MTEKLLTRFFSAPAKQSYFLFGPRGTGKTCWLKQRYGKDALHLDFNDPETTRFYLSKPERLKEVVAADNRHIVVIDEVQRVPEVLTVVHGLIEDDKSRQFVLTGSSARKLKRSGVDLLAGRAIWKTMSPFFATELGQKFELSSALQTGLLPLVYGAEDPLGTLRTYVALYIKEEVQAEGLVRNVAAFSRFVEAVSFSHGSILNVANIARECAVERKVVAAYIEILSDLLLCFTVPVFAKKAKRAVTSRPKFYLFDTGVFRSIRPSGPFDRAEEIEGAAVEGLVAQQLHAWVKHNDDRDKLTFWRTKAGSEVDFILYGPSGIFAFEVKNTNTIRPKDLRHLKTFLGDYPMARGFFLYRGTRKRLIDNILCLPCADFLRQIAPDTDFRAIE